MYLQEFLQGNTSVPVNIQRLQEHLGSLLPWQSSTSIWTQGGRFRISVDVVKNLENILHLLNINVSTVVYVIQPDLDITEFTLHLTFLIIKYWNIIEGRFYLNAHVILSVKDLQVVTSMAIRNSLKSKKPLLSLSNIRNKWLAKVSPFSSLNALLNSFIRCALARCPVGHSFRNPLNQLRISASLKLVCDWQNSKSSRWRYFPVDALLSDSL